MINYEEFKEKMKEKFGEDIVFKNEKIDENLRKILFSKDKNYSLYNYHMSVYDKNDNLLTRVFQYISKNTGDVMYNVR